MQEMSDIFEIPDCPAIKALLDKVIAGDDQAYYEFLRLNLQRPAYGKWQLIHTLEYLCEKAKQNPETKLNNCNPLILSTLALFLHDAKGLLESIPEGNEFLILLKSAANIGNCGAQFGLLALEEGITYRKILTSEEHSALIADAKILI